MATTKAKWKKLKSFPRRFMSNVIAINDHDIICAAPNVYGKESNGIYKFNKYVNEWKLFIKYPNNFMSTGHTLCINNSTNQLYLYGLEHKLIQINCHTHEFTTVIDLPSFGCYPPTVVIENDFHVICGAKNNKHLRLDLDNNCSQFKELHSFKVRNNELYGHSLLYIATKKILLLFGGGCNTSYGRWILKYSAENNVWSKMSKNYLPYQFFKTACVLVKNELETSNYVIMFGGGVSDYAYRTSIHVFNLHQSWIKRSSVSLPTGNPVHAALIKDMNIVCLVNGFIKMFYNTNDNCCLIPSELIQCIMSWVGQEIWYIHLIDRITSRHWKIEVNKILNSI